MKKLLLLTGFITTSLFAQTVPNGGFENWTPYSYDEPLYYQTSNFQNFQLGLPANVTKVTDPQQGSYAIRLTTTANAIDTTFGYVTNGNPDDMSDGIPYNQHPVTLTGYYKSNIPAGDTGFILVIFKQATIAVSFDATTFTGVHNTYTPFTVTLNIPPLATPDSVIVGAVSSNAFSGQIVAGSMLQLDNLVFTGVSSQPAQLNGSFENWVPRTNYLPNGWNVIGDTMNRAGSPHGGTYCLRLGNQWYGGNNYLPGLASTGYISGPGPVGGRPYVLLSDTLKGWYKFIPTGIDSATVYVNCTNMGSSVGGAYVGLPPAAVWTQFSIPFMNAIAPDTMSITFAASFDSFDSTNTGSVLFVDDVSLASSPVSVGPAWNAFGFVKLFPNPATEATWLEFTLTNDSPVLITILDAAGRKISTEEISAMGAQRYKIETEGLAEGVYTVTLEQNGMKTVRRFVKQ